MPQGLIGYDPTKSIEVPPEEHKEILLLTIEPAWKLINTAAEFRREIHRIIYMRAHADLHG